VSDGQLAHEYGQDSYSYDSRREGHPGKCASREMMGTKRSRVDDFGLEMPWQSTVRVGYSNTQV
jgi:hypothetical protein